MSGSRCKQGNIVESGGSLKVIIENKEGEVEKVEQETDSASYQEIVESEGFLTVTVKNNVP